MIKQTACFIVIFFLAQTRCAGAAHEFHVAKSAYEDGLYKIAETQLIQFIKNNPGSEILRHAYFLLGECRFNLEDFSGAAAAYAESSKSPQKKEAGLYRAACAYYLMEEKDRCRELFGRYLETFPRGRFSGQAAFRLAECALKENKFGEAGDFFVLAARSAPEPERKNHSLYSAGVAYLKAGNYPAAESCFQELLEASPGENIKPRALYWLGQARLEGGETEGAKTAFTAVFEDFPGSVFADAALYRQGAGELEGGNYPAAADMFKAVIENYKDSPFSHEAKLNLGIALENLGERAAAAGVFRELADSEACDNLRAEALFRKASALISEGDSRGGLEALERLKTLFPGSRESILGALKECAVRYGEGDYAGVIRTAGEAVMPAEPPEIKRALDFMAASSHFALGNYSSAAGVYEKIIQGGPEGLFSGESAVYYAKSLYKLGLHEKSAAILKDFMHEFPENRLAGEAYFSLADALFALEEFIHAAAYYGKASESPELASPAMFRRGDSLDRAGMHEEAEASYGQAGGALKESAELKIAEMRYRAGKFSEAAETAANLAGGRGREAGHAKYMLALSRVHMNKLGEAARELTEFIEQFPGNRHLPAAFFNLGVIHFARGNYPEARSYFEDLDRLFPGAPESAEAKYFAGLCLLSAGQAEQAAKKLEQYLPSAGGRGDEARLVLGGFYYEAGEYGRALATLAPLKNTAEGELALKAHFQLGLAYEAEKKYREALEMFRLVSRNGADGGKPLEAMFKTAGILSRQKEYGKALESYRKIEKTASEPEIVKEARYYSAVMLQSLGRYGEAMNVFQGIEPPLTEAMEADISFRKAQCLREAGNPEEALLEFLKTAYLYPCPQGPALAAMESAAAILRLLERGDEAVKIYKKIIEMDPEGIKGEVASQKIREIKP